MQLKRTERIISQLYDAKRRLEVQLGERCRRTPHGLWKTTFNDKGWDDMQVPGVWELNGYGDPIYVNVGYAWRNQFKNNPPEVPTETTTSVLIAAKSLFPLHGKERYHRSFRLRHFQYVYMGKRTLCGV